MRRRLILAVLASAAVTGCGIALLATSGFLLARASQHPNIVAISLAVVAVRGLSVGRRVFRYADRLASHDVAFRILVDIRVRTFQRLERLAPAGLRTLRPGDVLARLVSDVDATQDLFLRGVAPPPAAAAAGTVAVIACLLMPPSAGLALAAGLLRFADLAGGSVTLGGAGLSGYAADDVRMVIGGCAQDPHIFPPRTRPVPPDVAVHSPAGVMPCGLRRGVLGARPGRRMTCRIVTTRW